MNYPSSPASLFSTHARNENIKQVKAEITVKITAMRADVEKGALSQADYERRVSEFMRDPNSFEKEG